MDKTIEEKTLSIEQLKDNLKVSNAVFEGVKAQNNWKNGKQVTEEQFKTAVDKFLKTPIGGNGKEDKG